MQAAEGEGAEVHLLTSRDVKHDLPVPDRLRPEHVLRRMPAAHFTPDLLQQQSSLLSTRTPRSLLLGGQERRCNNNIAA